MGNVNELTMPRAEDACSPYSLLHGALDHGFVKVIAALAHFPVDVDAASPGSRSGA